MILVTIPKIVACFMFIFVGDVWVLLVGRAFLGVGEVGTFTILPMYSSEVASVSRLYASRLVL